MSLLLFQSMDCNCIFELGCGIRRDKRYSLLSALYPKNSLCTDDLDDDTAKNFTLLKYKEGLGRFVQCEPITPA